MSEEQARLTLVAAVAGNGVIGAAGGMPWHLPEDLKRFRRLTTGHSVVMGRRTYESIGRPLPNRRNIVVTRDQSWRADGVETAAGLAEAIALAGDGTVMVIGGGQIYVQALPLADTLEITHIDLDVDGDTHFPGIDPAEWAVAAEEHHDGYRFTTYRRVT